jgi:predicted NBD/HSP70 family sugar kinase
MVKNQNRQLVFRHLFRNNPVTRATIATETGLSQGTVKTIIDEFLGAGIVEERKDVSAPVGRKPSKVYLNATARTFGVLNIRPGRLEFHELDLALEPLRDPAVAVEEAALPSSQEYAEFLSTFLRRTIPPLAGMGVVVPGAYVPETDRVVCHIMPELTHVSLRQLIEEALDVPVAIGEDVHVAALAETRYPFNVPQPLFYLYAGQGVGGAYVAAGRVLSGANQMAGEIGQMTMPDGRRLEEIVSWPAFLRKAGITEGDRPETAVQVVHERLAAGDDAVAAALEQLVTSLTEALDAVICILNPRTIVLGGPYSELGEAVTEPVRSRLLPRLMPEHAEGLAIIPAHGGQLGMVRGAALAALEQWLVSEFTVGGEE